jgi:ketosteroid isomerase-like protein
VRHFYQKQVEKLEEQWRQAQLTSDTATMDRLLADDYIGIGRTGIVTTKAQTIERYQKRTVVVKKLDISDMKVAIHGETAVVTAKADVDATDNGAAIHNSFRYTRVYVSHARRGLED